MSASIGGASTTSSGLTEAFDAARPQVQSRRVSLKLGPLGITYSTDQVLWGAAASAAASATSASAAGGVLNADADAISGSTAGLLGANADAAAARQAENEQAAQTEAQQAGRSFSQEMFQAWRRQVAQREEGSATYGPDGSLKGSDVGAADSGDDDAVESIAASQPAGDGETEPPAQSAGVAPVSRMRRAIAAYLACARDGGAGTMLSAVA